MRRILAVSAFLVLLCVSVGSAGLVKPRKMDTEEKIAPRSARMYVAEFKGGEPGKVIVSGNYQTCLGLYIFDKDGNCVAHDDRTWPQACDDLNVEWIAATTGRYQVAVWNTGYEINTYNLAMR
ncbi:MAG TPA: hypothetical protein VFE62_18370 [Gemmataceae bacterium]|nr:hypothetical protein [Gemmataceae bacterium]